MRLAGWAAMLSLLAPLAAEGQTRRLSGIVVAGADRLAIFAGAPGEAMLAVREGDAIGDERVDAIEPGGVLLDGPAGRRLVTPGHDTLTRAALAPTLAPVPLIDPYRRERETENDQ